MGRKYQLTILELLLVGLGMGAALSKHFALGYTFSPGGKETG